MKKTVVLFLFSCLITKAQIPQLIEPSYFLGRDYYILRSGRAKMVIQSDKADIGPAFSFMLFDAPESNQTARKDRAFNFVPGKGFASSALEVIMKNYAFTALGHNASTRWTIEEGIPSVEAAWWAGGIKVKEILTPETMTGVFKRTITLEAVDLVTSDTAFLQLSLPIAASYIKDNVMIAECSKALLAITVKEGNTINITQSKDKMMIGPILFQPGEKKIIESYLFLDLSSKNIQELAARAATADQWISGERNVAANKWKNSNTLETKDEILQHMFDNNRFILPAYVADNGKMDAGIFEYGAQWVRDASNTALGMIHTGEFELAKEMLNHILKNMILPNGTTMIGGSFDNPDREQFDQMGEFMHVMKSYVDWSGDVSLITENKDKLIAMVERPLNKNFRDSTGMVHNRREFWERTFDDAYELVYQAWVIQGLRDAADLSRYLKADKKARQWRSEADRIENAMLYNPKMKLVDNGHLIKRRNVTGEVVDKIKLYGWMDGAPAKVESMSRLMPDASMALPIAMNIVDPKSALSKNTLAELEKLWNERWDFGGYDRYNTSSQGDQPGPWTFATAFIMRAQHEAGMLDLSRRSFEWLYYNAGGRTGAWFEEVPVIRSQAFSSGLLPWSSAEVSFFIVHHLLGMKFHGEQMVIKPVLYATSAPLKADIRFRKDRIHIEIDGIGPIAYAAINGGAVINPNSNGAIDVPKDFASGSILIYTKK